jgi:hypothetical protein
LNTGCLHNLAAELQLLASAYTYGDRNGTECCWKPEMHQAFCPKPGTCSNFGCLQLFKDGKAVQAHSEAAAVLSCGGSRSAASPCLKKSSATIILRGPQLNSHRSRRFGAEKGGAKSASSTSMFFSDSLSKCGRAVHRVRTPPSTEQTGKC